ncbi:MAG: hypothetical protein OEV85_14905, partial [Candidatus Thorarchaeota archaeon]|nr:hypothetical protein [Candidatus Thorarchaeota archaeon]
MKLKQKFTKNILMRIGVPRMMHMIDKQKSIVNLPDSLSSTSNSPRRFEIQLEAAKMMREREDFEMRHTFPMTRMFSIMKNIDFSVDSLSKNPSKPSINATSDFIETLGEFARKIGLSHIGYVKL